MQKIKKILIVLIIIICIPIKVFAQDLEDEYEELNYVWLEEEIQNAKEGLNLKINSKYAVVYDRASKTIIYGKNETIRVPMASTTKIMTAIVMLENVNNLHEKIEVTKQAALVGGSRLGLKTGDIITYNDLLYGLMLCSGNDAATQIAISVGGSIDGFANLMNNKAKKLGLKDTNFITPHGLDNEKHYTTALELAKITDYALNIEKFTEVVSTKTYGITINGQIKTIKNTNELLGYLEGVYGVKTGFTNNAGRCLVTSVDRKDFNIITVVLGADTKKIRTSDSIKLIEYVYKNFELVDLKEIIEQEFEYWEQINNKRIKIYKGQEKWPKIGINELKYNKFPVLKSEINNINVSINVEFNQKAPLEKNESIGSIKIYLNTTEIMKVDIINCKKIDKKTVFFYLKELFLSYNYCRNV